MQADANGRGRYGREHAQADVGNANTRTAQADGGNANPQQRKRTETMRTDDRTVPSRTLFPHSCARLRNRLRLTG